MNDPSPATLGSAPSSPRGPARTPRPLGGTVSRGMGWMMFNTVVGRGASAAAQVALAYLLTASDFGVAAIAIAVSSIVQVFRDGGVSRYLVQQGIEEYKAAGATYFWMAGTFNLATAAVMAGLAPAVARIYGDPRMLWILLVVAAYLPLSTPSMMLQTRLTIDMRFGTLARIVAASSLLRHGGVVLFAWLGFGPISFVAPMPFVALLEWALMYAATRDRPWKGPFGIDRWGRIFHQTKWLILGTLASSAYYQGEYVVLGLLVTTSVVGVYFFAFQLAKQVIVLLMINMQTVLLPALSRLKDEPERQRAGVLRTTRLLMLVAAPASLILACTIDPLEALIFRGRWDTAVPAIQILSLFLPLNILSSIPRTVLMSIGRFRLWCALMLLDAVGVIIAASAGGWLTTDAAGLGVFAGEANDATGIALFVGAYTGLSTLFFARVALRPAGVRLRQLVRAFAPALCITLVAAAGAFAVDQLVLAHRQPLERLVIVTLLFGALFGLGTRKFLADDLRQFVGLMPARLRPALSTLLHLRSETAGAPRAVAAPPPGAGPEGDAI